MKSDKARAAMARYDAGYNCAQSVLGAFAQELGLDSELAHKLSSCFGGGMRMGATCGALSGALMVIGLAMGYSEVNQTAKELTEQHCLSFIARWKEVIGDTNCKGILGLDVSIPEQRQKGRDEGVFARYCPNCIEQSVEMLEEALAKNH